MKINADIFLFGQAFFFHFRHDFGNGESLNLRMFTVQHSGCNPHRIGNFEI